MNRRAKRASAIALTGPSAALLIIGLWPREARAATLNVNTFEMTIKNDNLCSLPEAILSVNSKSGEDGCTKAAGDGTDVIQLQAATATNEYVAVPATSPMIIRRGVYMLWQRKALPQCNQTISSSDQINPGSATPA